MINDNTILSSFNDRPTLLEWLKKVEDALKSDTAKSISVDNPETNVYIIKITFADGRIMYTEPIRLPDSVKGVSISNNHLVITMQSGLTDDLGVINPYAETIVNNSVTNTTEIGNNAVVDGNLQVNGNVLFGNSIISIQGTTKQNGILGTNADGQIAFKEISGGTQWYKHEVSMANHDYISFYSMFGESLKVIQLGISLYPAIITQASGPTGPNVDYFFPALKIYTNGRFYLYYVGSDGKTKQYEFNKSNINSDVVTAL